MPIFRIEEKDAVANFAAILAHIRRGDEVLIAEDGTMVEAMKPRAAAHPERLPAPQWDGEPSKRPWLRRRKP